jgi:hypothetical protein
MMRRTARQIDSTVKLAWLDTGQRLAQHTCSVPHKTTMPSRRLALGLLALTNRSSNALVIGVGPSCPNTRPYLVAVISKNCISRRMLLSAEISRSMVRYMGWNCEFCVWGNRILASNCPTNRM